MAAVSSPGATPVSVLVPSASAAHTSARLATLFEPGTTTSAASGSAAVRTRHTYGAGAVRSGAS